MLHPQRLTVVDHTPSDMPNSGGDSESDWAASFVDRMMRLVQRTRATTTLPAVTASRGVVFGLLAALCLISALVLVGLSLFRLVDLVLPGGSWVAYLFAGGLFCGLGGLLWSHRSVGRTTR